MGGPALGVGIVVLLGAVILGVIVISIVAWIVRWRNRVRTACCGSCRYPVEGLTTFTCPECGADFRTAGILVPGMRPKHRIHVAEIFAAWAAVALVSGLITAGLAGSTTWGRRMSFIRMEDLTSKSGTIGLVRVIASGSAATDSSPLLAAPRQLVGEGMQRVGSARMVLDVDVRAGLWKMRPDGVFSAGQQTIRGTMPLKDSDVLAWLVVASFTPPSSAPDREVGALTAYFNSGGTAIDASVFSISVAATSVRAATASWVFAGSASLWIVIFAMGCVVITRVNTTRKRSVPTAKAQPAAA